MQTSSHFKMFLCFLIVNISINFVVLSRFLVMSYYGVLPNEVFQCATFHF